MFWGVRMRIYILFHASLFQSLLYVSISIYLLYKYPGCVLNYLSTKAFSLDMNNAQAWILHSCQVEDSPWRHLCPLNIRQKAVFWLRIFHHRHGRNLNRTSVPEVQQTGCSLQLRSHIQMCSPFSRASTPYVSRRWKKHLYIYIYIYLPLFFDSNWPFKCTTTINPTVALQTMRRSLLPKCDTRRGTLGLDESRAEKGGQAAALFTKC